MSPYSPSQVLCGANKNSKGELKKIGKKRWTRRVLEGGLTIASVKY
jgi:hypothetical protein